MFSEKNKILLDFSNIISEDSLNVFDYHYLYNGGGVAIADFDNDGIKDIFLGGNQVSSALLRGDVNLNYTNITLTAGLMTDAWINGVSTVDINHDGLMDLYLSVGGPNCDKASCKNLLFINKTKDGKIKFEEQAENFGLDISAYSQQALFFDMDQDGDLDMYQLQNFVDPKTKNYPKPKNYYSDLSFDKLYLNQEAETGQISFKDVSKEYGIDLPGFGLGIALTDVNNDGYPDIYVANDFITDDIFYLNIKGKSFKDISRSVLKHTSYNSMGVDIADFNGDSHDDILVVDMLPYENDRQKTMLGSMNYDKYRLSVQEGYNNQYIRNTLNMGWGMYQDSILSFTDHAPQYNIHQTDWSWSPLIADFDNNGEQDIFITNGYGKNITDLDFVNYNSNVTAFGEREITLEKIKQRVNTLPAVTLPNKLFLQNDENLEAIETFKPGISNGAAYGDLDNDGDLDLVLNNLNEPAYILLNDGNNNNHLKLKLKSKTANRNAIGSRIKITLENGRTIEKNYSPVRSYLSSMDYELVFGLGKSKVKEIAVDWPNGLHSILREVPLNSSIVIHDSTAVKKLANKIEKAALFKTNDIFKGKRKEFKGHEYSIQPLLFKPCMNTDIQLTHNAENIYTINKAHALVSINSITNEEKVLYSFNSEQYIHDLYFAKLDKSKDYLLATSSTDINGSSAKLEILEIDKSGSVNLVDSKSFDSNSYLRFEERVKGEIEEVYLFESSTAASYPIMDKARVYKLDLTTFDVTEESMGQDMSFHINALKRADLNNDQLDDVILCSEWAQPIIQINQGGNYEMVEWHDSLALNGLWQNATIADLDNDGDIDIILSNLGRNSRLNANASSPLYLVTSDLNGDERIDPLFSVVGFQGQDFTYHTRDDIASQIPKVKDLYNSYRAFSQADFLDIVGGLNKDVNYASVNNLSSIVLENNSGEFIPHQLPDNFQNSINNKTVTLDVNGDGLLDIIGFMNNEKIEVHNGNLDGSNGVVLINEGEMKFKSINTQESGVYINGEVREVSLINETEIAYAIGDQVKMIKLNNNSKVADYE